jgi:hypothetical protein
MRFLSFLGFRQTAPARLTAARRPPPASPTASEILAGRGGPFFRVERAPDGRSAIIVAPLSMRMSHEVWQAVLYTLPDERPIAEIGNSLWNADRITWTDEGRGVGFDLCRYPGDTPGVSVVIDIARGRARMDAGPEMPLAELSAALEADYWRKISAKQSGKG